MIPKVKSAFIWVKYVVDAAGDVDTAGVVDAAGVIMVFFNDVPLLIISTVLVLVVNKVHRVETRWRDDVKGVTSVKGELLSIAGEIVRNSLKEKQIKNREEMIWQGKKGNELNSELLSSIFQSFFVGPRYLYNR